jgi:uncharacterized protein (DUF362 family)
MNTPWSDPRVMAVRVSHDDERGFTAALRRIGQMLGWTAPGFAAFAHVVTRRPRVVVKPNWVMHANAGAGGSDALVTSPNLVRAVVAEVVASGPASVVLGDAPLQSCDFGRLMTIGGLGAWARDLAAREPRFRGVRDYRRTICQSENGFRAVVTEDVVPSEQFIEFDLGRDSLLEPVSAAGAPFRVTQYDPRRLARMHRSGRHCYLVARDFIDADLVVNLPKLKTHRKAGLTAAIKNLVGINGNKEYLPHHRRHSPDRGGDCYPTRSAVKAMLELAFERVDMASSLAAARTWQIAAGVLSRALALTGDEIGVEGSWSGNDTVWRMSLDLNRILLYGRADGTLSDTRQREVVHVVDAVCAGQGDGPLAPEPLPLGVILGAGNAAAADWVAARLLRYEPDRIPIVREAFGRFRWPVSPFEPTSVSLAGDLGHGLAHTLLDGQGDGPAVRHPAGWRDAAVSAPHVATAVEASR